MKVDKSVRLSVLIGIVSSIFIILASLAHFVIPLGGDSFIGIGEVFTTLSAALGGPVSVIVTLLVTYGMSCILYIDLYRNIQTIYITLADASAHLLSMLVVVFCYSRWLYPIAKRTSTFLLGWFLVIAVYYFLAFLPLVVVLQNLTNPDFSATYSSFVKKFFPEFLGTATITTLLWFALPVRFRLVKWIKPKQISDLGDRTQDTGKEGTPCK